MHWLLNNLTWLFDGVGGAVAIALLGLLAKRLVGSETQSDSRESHATLSAHESNVTNSPVASGSGINQTVDARTFNLQLGKPPSENASSARIRDRQVDALLAIYSKLEQGLFYLQRAVSNFKFRGEVSERELLHQMSRELAAASEEISRNKLLIDPGLTRKLDEFFSKVISAGTTLEVAMNPMTPDGEQRAKFWREAQGIACKDLPLVLESIQEQSRAMIHSPSK